MEGHSVSVKKGLATKRILNVLVVLAVLLLGGSVVNWMGKPTCPLRSGLNENQYPPPSIWTQFSQFEVAHAIPAFSRKNNFTCATCHNAVPYLNSAGRSFKEAGYRFLDEDGEDTTEQNNQKFSEQLTLEPKFPIAARIKGFLFNKARGGHYQLRPLHEIEIFGMGNFARIGSFHIELEAEDEGMFQPMAMGRFGVHPLKHINIIAGYGSVFSGDPYNSLAEGGHRLTVSHKAPLNQAYASNFALRRDAQFVNLYGRAGALFYSGGITTGPRNNFEGNRPRVGFGRLAYDVVDWASVGALFIGGEKGNGATPEVDVNVLKYGGDINIDFKDVHFDGLVLASRDRPDGGTKETNLAAFGELFYTWRVGNRPILMPLVRVDWAQAQGNGDTTSITGNISSYVWENFRTGFEFSGDVDVPTGTQKAWRTTLFADLAF